MRDMVLILNFDDACTRAIARGLRAEHVYCKIVPGNIALEEVRAQQPLGVILSGGVTGGVPGGMDMGLLQEGYPLLAMGDTAAMLCRALGGDAQETAICNSIGGVAFARCTLTEGLDDCERMLHNVRRLRLPPGAQVLAESQRETVGYMLSERNLYAVQFTLEQNDTDGMRLLLNFVLSVCGCTRWWDYEAFVGRAEEEIRRVVGDGRAVCAMTGGLNSGITALLAHRALGDRLQCIFVDTGLLRENEAAQVMRFYHDQMGLSIVNVQAQERFTQALSGLVEPDDKRRAIGQTLQAVMDETLADMGEFTVILRSTTCDDVLRGVNPASKPGLHAELPVVEPLRELFKDEVRRVGEYLNVPTEILSRQSFPSSGLALRILGDVTPARLQTLRAADLIFTEEIAAAGLNKRLWQYFALLGALPGEDTRVIIALRAMQSSDPAQLAHAARLPFDLLERVTDRIRRERPEVAHVLYDLNPSSRSTGAEW